MIVQLKSYIEDVFEDLEINVTMCCNVIASLPRHLQDYMNVEGNTFEYLK